MYRTVSGGSGTPVCNTGTSVTTCHDATAPATATSSYEVVALDEVSSTGASREGAASAANTITPGHTRPNPPPTLTAVVSGDKYRLDWGAPATPLNPYQGGVIRFFRIYRGGTAVADRFDRTGLGTELTFTDTSVAGETRRYWVTAVDDNYSESLPVGPGRCREPPARRAGLHARRGPHRARPEPLMLGATLTTFNGAERTQRVNQDQNESQDATRRVIDGIARQLRNLASPSTAAPNAVERSEGYDLVLQTVGAAKPGGSANDRNIERVRYCLGASSGGKATLWRQEQTWTDSVAPGVPSTASCPDPAWPQVPPARQVAADVVNRELSKPIFSFNASALSSINAVTIELFLDANPGKAPARSRLASGVFLRDQNQAPVPSARATDTGTGHRLLLNGSGSEDPEGGTLTRYEWLRTATSRRRSRPARSRTGRRRGRPFPKRI